jgi:uncharacterized protein
MPAAIKPKPPLREKPIPNSGANYSQQIAGCRVLVNMNMSESLPPMASATEPAVTSTRSWEVLCHLSSLIFLIGVPFGNIVGPLIVWLLKKDASPGVDAHGKESLNFHISWTLYWLLASTAVGLLCIVLIGILFLPFLIAGYIIGGLMMILLSIIASIKASNGVLYRYPLTIRFL